MIRWRRKTYISPRVEKSYQAEFAYFFIYGKHTFFVNVKTLIFRVELNPFHSEGFYSFKLVESVRLFGWTEPKGIRSSRYKRRGKVVDRMLLARVCCDIHNNADVNAVFFHFTAKPIGGTVRLRNKPSRSVREFLFLPFRLFFGKTMGMEVYFHNKPFKKAKLYDKFHIEHKNQNML